jgi:hypothetical protein
VNQKDLGYQSGELQKQKIAKNEAEPYKIARKTTRNHKKLERRTVGSYAAD